ncbi:signal transduction histidine kinase, nitrogen specific, NtrB [Candidatus Moduliflexus flocculans]|uniref:histidine kinase n=1 Tax=Candidatus Moduliflexus flocculans TaxID=1499966 RepID=A0A0S6VUI1_9BACT|nr:signal transduction histidine kinase, nitrogen specific, NtrB [Candidatus Moduliflexus flocculans]
MRFTAIIVSIVSLTIFPLAATANNMAYTPIPEPATFSLFLTLFGLLAYRRWGQRRQRSITSDMPEIMPSAAAAHWHLLGQMSGGVIHDVKNALTGIRTCAEVLNYDDMSAADRQEFTATIIAEVDRLTAMLQDVLAVARGETRSQARELTSINTLLRGALETMSCEFRCRNIHIHTDLQTVPDCSMNASQIMRVIMNLFSNACDAMPDGGTLTISSRVLAQSVQVTISDTGCGMSPELQARLFEPFATEGKSNGTGLGMTIVKSILDAHHAVIRIDSLSERGTTVRIEIPCKSGNA